jgi:hypothetical protein
MRRLVLLAVSLAPLVPMAVTVLLGALLGSALPGCDSKSSAPSAEAPDASAGTDKYVTADPKLARALQAAESASGAGDNGPPPEGIFGPGIADKRHPKGTPTTIDVTGDGAEPRVSLAGTATPDAIRAADNGPAALRLGEQRGRMARPTVDFSLAFGPAKKDDGGADLLVGEVKKATPAPTSAQMGPLPAGMDKEIGSLAGTQLRIKLTPDGRVGDITQQLGKASQPELDVLAQAAVETIALMTVPLPPRPVGVGAQWIAETRMPFEGLDVITYRAFHVKSIADNRVHLSVDIKAYATDKNATVQGIPKDATFVQFEADSQGEMEMVRGESLARIADLQERVVMLFQAPGSPPPSEGVPGQPAQPQMGVLPLQIQIQATLARGEDLRAASAKQ